MKVVFVSNYLNHHQIPFCEALIAEGIDFTFIATEKMDEERLQMGWGVDLSLYSYARFFGDDSSEAEKLIDQSDIVIFGGVEDENYIAKRLDSGKIVIRYSERLYKEGQWKFISPRGLMKKYHDHVRHNNDPVYLFCAGGYVASDFSLIHAYKDKMFTWGYFPQAYEYEIDKLMNQKATDQVYEIVWAGRMIDWKHPDYAIDVAKYLADRGVPFHMTMVGDGVMREELEQRVKAEKLEEKVVFTGFCKPDKVREYMLIADVFLFTSDYREGWGAVLNEAMNSGCACVASSSIGAVPYLLKHSKNGLVYRENNVEELCHYALKLSQQPMLCTKLGMNAYNTIIKKWNPTFAAKSFAKFANGLMEGRIETNSNGPLSVAPIVKPKDGYLFTRGGN